MDTNGAERPEDAERSLIKRICEKLNTLQDPQAFRAWANTIALNMAGGI